MGRRHQKARKRSCVLSTNHGHSWGGGAMSENQIRDLFCSETEQEVGSRTKVEL